MEDFFNIAVSFHETDPLGLAHQLEDVHTKSQIQQVMWSKNLNPFVMFMS